MNIAELYEIYRQYPSVQTDTRKLKQGDLFFALRGPNFNANAFAAAALDAGAAYAVIDDPAYHLPTRTILVDDVLQTLQQLALCHRNQFTIPFLGITGSNGKTTTKELIHAVLSRKFRTYTTKGNLNNHIGVPLTLLGIGKDAEMAVVEMGANHVGEIASYCVYALPDYGLITNIGKAHLEGFGGIEGVKKGKGELFDHLRIVNGTALVNADDSTLMEMSGDIKKKFTYGVEQGDVRGRLIKSEPFLVVQAEGMTIETRLVGAYNLPNVLAAIAAGKLFGVEEFHIKKALQEYEPSNSRSQLIDWKTNKVILDAYNANPSSMKAAIENFARLSVDNKVLVLGAMAELGAGSVGEHQEIIDLIMRYSWKAVVLVGGDYLKVDTGFDVLKDTGSARDWIAAQNFDQCYLLVKGSRSMQMERVLD